jgi:hypothetical protein
MEAMAQDPWFEKHGARLSKFVGILIQVRKLSPERIQATLGIDENDLHRRLSQDGVPTKILRQLGALLSVDFRSLMGQAELPEDSPWGAFPYQFSPDGKWLVHYAEQTEIAMGGPMMATVRINEKSLGHEDGNFGVPGIWSEDSRLFAVPKWNNRAQSIHVFDFEERKEFHTEARYSVLQLRTLTPTHVTATDSPALHPTDVKVDFKALPFRRLHC